MKRRDDGFTIIEALIALLIIAASISGLHHAVGSGFSAARHAKSQAVAIEHARSKLAEAGTATMLTPGVTTGTTPDGFSWQVDVRPREDARSALAGAYVGYWVTATVAWSGGQSRGSQGAAELTTLRITRAPK